jgi:hypothetical protein
MAVEPKKKPIKGIKIKGVPPPAMVLINQLAKLPTVKKKMLKIFKVKIKFYLTFFKAYLKQNLIEYFSFQIGIDASDFSFEAAEC